MRGVVVAAILIFALMVAVKDGRLMRKAGLSGGCTVIATESEETGTWQACTPGKLQGAPDLTRQSCTSVKKVDDTEYWHCPADIRSSHG
jgi:hypothetical protein